MNRRLLIAIFSALTMLMMSASDPVLMTINGKEISRHEFEYLYNKNKLQQIEPQSIEEYIDMFIVFKLKVADAEAAGIDSTATFIEEYNGYCAELLHPLDATVTPTDYQNLANEYRDGMLLFEISNRKVWEKSITDIAGLETFFHANFDRYKIDADSSENSLEIFPKVKSRVIMDYQKELEDKWIEEIRKKYEVVINRPMLDSFIASYSESVENTHE